MQGHSYLRSKMLRIVTPTFAYALAVRAKNSVSCAFVSCACSVSLHAKKSLLVVIAVTKELDLTPCCDQLYMLHLPCQLMKRWPKQQNLPRHYTRILHCSFVTCKRDLKVDWSHIIPRSLRHLPECYRLPKFWTCQSLSLNNILKVSIMVDVAQHMQGNTYMAFISFCFTIYVFLCKESTLHGVNWSAKSLFGRSLECVMLISYLACIFVEACCV